MLTYLTFGERLRRRSVGQERIDLLDAQNGFVAQLETHHLLVVTTVSKCQQDLSKYLKRKRIISILSGVRLSGSSSWTVSNGDPPPSLPFPMAEILVVLFIRPIKPWYGHPRITFIGSLSNGLPIG